MQFLYLLESIRNPVLDFFFSLITYCGDEVIFMAVGMIVFWCFSKNEGYYLLCVGFLGTAINQFLKIVCRIPRPWVRDPNFTIVESAKEAAGGYSFPSGHTQSSIGLFGGVARWNKNKILRIIMIALCVIVPFSRMYLGVHTPADVLVSVAIALVLIFVGYPLFNKAVKSPKVMYCIFGFLALVMASYLCFVCFYDFPADIDMKNLESAQKNGFTLMGCILGIFAVYTADIKWTKFETKAVWWAQIIKAAIGIGLVLAAKELLKIPLNAIMPANTWARLVRYFLMVIIGGVLWPMTFKCFAKLGKKKEDN